MSSVDPWTVDAAGCRRRQQRLTAEMAGAGLELAILIRPESVQWLTGAFTGIAGPAAAAMDAGGRVTLALPERKIDLAAAADERIPYAAKLHSTTRDDQRSTCLAALLAALPRPRRGQAGAEWSLAGPQIIEALGGEAIDVEMLVVRLRRRKEEDELRLLARANEANGAMYRRAREIVSPGLNELDLYNELHAAAVRALGEPLTYFGQDFQAGARGGSPRNRAMEAGELVILDLGVGFRGYYSDNARTIAVGGEPTEVQRRAWQAASDVFALVEAEVRPGASCREVFEKTQRQLDQFKPWIFNHHLGHGVGLAPQEGPHLNPRWDDVFEEGNFLAVEPGLYHEELRFGVRLEQNYVVTATGVTRLTDFPLEL